VDAMTESVPKRRPLRRGGHREVSSTPGIPVDEAFCLLDDVSLQTLDKRDHLTLFGLGNMELRKARGGVAKKHVPVAFADSHASMAQRHIPTRVVHGPTRTRAEEADQKLLLPEDAVLPSMRPEPTELRIPPQSGQQIVCHRCDPIVAT